MRVALIGPGAAGLRVLIGASYVVTGVHELARVLAARRLDADVVLLTSNTPALDMTALAAVPFAMPPVLILTRLGETDAVAALRAGATGLLADGQYTRAELIEAIRAVAGGDVRLSPGAVTAVVRHLRQTQPGREERQPLSRRERQVMDLMADGETNRRIAGMLGVSEKTVRNQVSAIYRKLNVRTRAEAVGHWLGRS